MTTTTRHHHHPSSLFSSTTTSTGTPTARLPWTVFHTKGDDKNTSTTKHTTKHLHHHVSGPLYFFFSLHQSPRQVSVSIFFSSGFFFLSSPPGSRRLEPFFTFFYSTTWDKLQTRLRYFFSILRRTSIYVSSPFSMFIYLFSYSTTTKAQDTRLETHVSSLFGMLFIIFSYYTTMSRYFNSCSSFKIKNTGKKAWGQVWTQTEPDPDLVDPVQWGPGPGPTNGWTRPDLGQSRIIYDKLLGGGWGRDGQPRTIN